LRIAGSLHLWLRDGCNRKQKDPNQEQDATEDRGAMVEENATAEH
jgi:hypothetical protein